MLIHTDFFVKLIKQKVKFILHFEYNTILLMKR